MMITTDIVFILNINTLNSTVPESETTTTKTHKLVIPFLATPKWKTMMDWRRLRQDTGIADEINKRKLVPGPHHYASYEKTPVNKISSADEIKNFGNLFFV
ncbi:unnamed protein product [Leptosia nina]|uniref:Uncharacterized protein n=1 Tax=Leptosia nina TaxID=320188 RepID=A0AAV1JD31_9NEOP